MSEKKIEIGGRLHSIATGNVLAGANEIFDDDKNKKQSEINTETYSLVNDVNERLNGLSPDQQSALTVAAKATNNETKLGYYVCGTEGNVAAKVISDATGYILSKGGSMKVKMTNANTAANATLNINSTGAKPLYYDGERASVNNSWEAGETVEVYYDGTNYYANNVAGGSGSGDGAFDISAKTGQNYETLTAALTAANTILPASKKKGGMSIKFVQFTPATYSVVKTEGLTEQPTGTLLQSASAVVSGTYTAAQLSDFATLPATTGAANAITYYVAVSGDAVTYTSWVITKATNDSTEYVQYRLMKPDWSNDVSDWQGVDSEPVAGSRNLVESGGINKFTNSAILVGANNTVKSCRFINVFAGHIYRIDFRERWANDNVTPSNYKLNIGYVVEGNNTFISLTSTTATPQKSYTVTLPDDVVIEALVINIRANKDVRVPIVVTDITDLKSVETDILEAQLDIARAVALKTELNFDGRLRRVINANGSSGASSANNSYSYYIDDGYDTLICKIGGIASGRHIAFYNSETISAETCLGVVNTGSDIKIVKVAIPEGTTHVLVNFPCQSSSPYLPSIDLKVALGKSSSFFGNYDKEIEELKAHDNNATLTSISKTLTGGNNTAIYISPIYTIPGRRYRIQRDVDRWDVEGISAGSTEIIGLHYEDLEGSTDVVEKRTKSSTTIFPNPFDFTASDVKRYYLHFKATSGIKVNFTITDITDLVPFVGIGSTNLITLMGGRDKLNDMFSNLHREANPLVLLYFSDIHGNTNVVDTIVDFRQNFSAIDDVLCGGDNVVDQPTDTYPFDDDESKKILTVVGNHDVYQSGTKLSSKEVFDIYYGEHTTHWTGVTFPEDYSTLGLCYWYKDYTPQGIRVIGVDCINWTNAEGTWIESVLADAITNNYHVVICLHYKPNVAFNGVRECTFNSLSGMSSQYANASLVQIVQTAINNGLVFVGYLFGHEHKDFFGYIEGYENQWGIAVDKTAPVSVDAYRPWDTNDRNYYAFDIVSINKNAGIMTIIKIGNNRDKFMRYKNYLAFDYINHKIVGNS